MPAAVRSRRTFAAMVLTVSCMSVYITAPMTEERHFKQAQRLAQVHGFGIDRPALAADALRSDWPVLRMENLDTALPLPPEAIPETISGLDKPASNSWL